MKSALLAATLLLPIHAYAWETTNRVDPVPVVQAAPTAASSAAASSASHSASHARSSSTSAVTVNNTASSPAGSGTHSAARAPDVLAPSISGGNPCSVGLSIGGSGPGASSVFGLMWESHDYALRQQAALLANLGHPDAAIELLCNDPWVRDAMAKRLTPCEIDRQRWIKAGWRP